MLNIKQPFFSAEDGGGDDNHQESGITFTPEQQAHMDKIIGQKLNSERAGKADYADLKEMAEQLKEFGYKGTVAEIKAELRQEADNRRKAAELEDLKQEAEQTGATPELLAEIKALKKEMAEIKQDKTAEKERTEAQKKADEDWTKQMDEFKEKHADVDLEKLATNAKFSSFLKKSNPNLSFLDVYDTYIDLISDAEKETIDKIKANDSRTTFSGKGKAEPTAGTHGLSENQQRLAKEGDMSFKEYADLLKNVQ